MKVVRPGIGIERFVSRVLKDSAMILCSPALADHRNLTGSRRAVLRSVVRCEHLNFLNHIRRHLKVLLNGDHPALAHETFLHGCSVQQSLIAGFLPPVNARLEGFTRTAGGDAW